MKNSFLLFLLAILFSACQPSQPSPTPQAVPTDYPTPTAIPTAAPGEIIGRVIDLDGNPIAGAVAESGGAQAKSDSQGWFNLVGIDGPQWVTVTGQGYISRTRAVAPGLQVLFRLTPDDGKTVVIHFAGDVMFGRRFFDPNEDGDTSDGLLPVNPSASDHLALLAPIQPLLSNAGLTVVNMESPVSDQPYISPRDPRPIAYHSTKTYVFASHPLAVQALHRAGVDVISLGNNHLYDLLEVGLEKSIQVLDQIGMQHFGAGINEAKAWEPAIVNAQSQTIAFIGCTTITLPIPKVSEFDISYTASDALDKGGAALCKKDSLRIAITQARADNDVVVVMIHGGYEYEREPSPNVAQLIEVARQSGADLIVNHHPHVVGGLNWNGATLTAYSMGNFIFDQTVWPTFESYLLAVTLREGKIIRAYIEPLIVEDYVAKGLTGEMADYVAREAAGRAAGPFVMENSAVEVDFGSSATTYTYTETLNGGEAPGQIFLIPSGKWLSGCSGANSLRLGRDLLWIGGFENQAVDPAGSLPLLWEQNDLVTFGKEYAHQGEMGLRLTRGSSNLEDSVATHLHRILVKPGDQLTVAGMLRASAGAQVSLQISWYPDTKGPSSTIASELINVDTPDTWQPFRLDVEVPPDNVATGVFLRLSPPAEGTSTADFDNLRLIQWAPEGVEFSPLYDSALIAGSCEAAFSQQVLPGMQNTLTP